ncbi:NAD(P)-dependent oxidoreductase [Candidatus Binatia bacterium]|nr:NAD(P)-dependent oxidoreductase [Candidatus Binatia bacterium]
MDIGFVGLGNMGRGMARSLLSAGHRVVVWNRSEAPAAELVRDGATRAATPADAAASGLVLSVLADDAAVEGVTLGADGVLAGLPSGGVHVSMSTISVALAERLTRAHGDAGQSLVAAPVFGRPDAAASAQLVVVAAGPARALERARAALEVVSRKLVVLGDEPAQANAVKLAGNYLVACAIEALAESSAFLAKSGVAPATFIELMTSTLFASPVYQSYGAILTERRFSPAGFKLPLGLKDVRLVLQAAERVAAPLPFASVLRDQLLSAIARGHGDLDWSAIALVAEENAGVPPRDPARSR